MSNTKLRRFHAKKHAITMFKRVGTHDHHILTEVLKDGEYDDFVNDLTPRDSVMDIGAQIGATTILMARKAHNIFSYEPMPETFNLLVKNCAHNEVTNAFLHNAAIMVQDEEVTERQMTVDKEMYTGSFSLVRKFDVKGPVVRCLSFENELIESDVNKIKMDVEGAEVELLYELARLLTKDVVQVDDIVFEYHPWVVDDMKGEGLFEIQRMYRELGFDIRPFSDMPYVFTQGDRSLATFRYVRK